MFSGIVAGLSEVIEILKQGDIVYRFRAGVDITDAAIGSSMCCSGVCLTIIGKGSDWFSASVSAETLRRTTIGSWSVGTRINLERALRYGEEIGGHLVSGHVDDVVTISSIVLEGDSRRLTFQVPRILSPYIASKGSVALDGVSLTINHVDGCEFDVNIIPHTLAVTTLGVRRPGDRVNLEVDLLARYVARALGAAAT